MQRAVLLQNVYSKVKTKGVQICYGTQGEPVTVISDRNTAIIVKNAKGFSYCVHKTQIKITHQILNENEHTQTI